MRDFWDALKWFLLGAGLMLSMALAEGWWEEEPLVTERVAWVETGEK